MAGGWAEMKNSCDLQIQDHGSDRYEIASIDGGIFKGNTLVIGRSLHCNNAAQNPQGSSWHHEEQNWTSRVMNRPGINQAIANMIVAYVTCLKYKPCQQNQPLIPSDSL